MIDKPDITRAARSVNFSEADEERDIEVQILPQEEPWPDHHTAATSEVSEVLDLPGFGKDFDDEKRSWECSRPLGLTATFVICACAYASPVLFAVMPKAGITKWEVTSCGAECEGLLLSLAFKLFLLFIACVALFRKPPALPRASLFRSLLLFLCAVLAFSFWLFYAVRVLNVERDYRAVLHFSTSMVDSLLFLHYLGVVLLLLRPSTPTFVVYVTRSPDGEARTYLIGSMSVQAAALFILRHYYRDFPVYNPWLEMAPRRRRPAPEPKVYAVDHELTQSARARAMAVASRGARDRFYEDEDYDRKVKKRRARLLSSAEEAFTHVRKSKEQAPQTAMDSQEAAQAIFPALARPLQKFLRATRQQPFYSLDSIVGYLSSCLKHDLSPRAFLQRFCRSEPVVFNRRDHRPRQPWTIICSQVLYHGLQDGTELVLRQNDVSILCQVKRLPELVISEDPYDEDKFVLRLNSETSV